MDGSGWSEPTVDYAIHNPPFNWAILYLGACLSARLEMYGILLVSGQDTSSDMHTSSAASCLHAKRLFLHISYFQD